MDCETNIGSIRALDEQIGEYERTVIKLKRTRNSLLNISKLPPEVLGNVFRWNVTRKGDFGGLDKRSHNFLAVCHHWSEVALRTPELWGFWGNTTKDWARLCCYSRTTPLDLVLKGNDYSDYYGDGLDSDLCDALNDRATEDTIRRVHLDADVLVRDIIFELTPKGEELRSSGMESLVLWNRGRHRPTDVSDFFAHYRFPKLQHLELKNCMISSWDHLSSRTSTLTTLELDFTDIFRISTPFPTTSQLFSMLASNPTLQRVALLRRAIPNDDASESSRVQLRHLKELRLGGNLQYVFKLLNQLDHPRNLDSLTLTLYGCDVMAISRTIGPYLRDHLQRRDRSQGGLNLLVSYQKDHRGRHITFHIGDAHGVDFSAPSDAEMSTFVNVDVVLSGAPHGSVLERMAHDFTTYAPSEEVVHFRMHNKLGAGADAYTRFPNLRALSFYKISLPTTFPDPNSIGEGKISPFLEHILLERVDLDGADWSPLVTFLARRVSSGNRLDTLIIVRSPHMRPEVMEGIRGMVRELKIDVQSQRIAGLFDVVDAPNGEDSSSESDFSE